MKPCSVFLLRCRIIAGLRSWCAAAGLAFAAAAGAVEPAGAGDASGVLGHRASVSEANALIAEVRVSLSRPARVFVEYDNPLAGRYRTAIGTSADEHVVPIVRLRPETTYDYTIFTVHGSDVSDATRGPGGSFTTGQLPAPLASIFTMATGRSSQPLILTGRAMQEDEFNCFVFWDEVGALVWYVRVEHHGPVARLPGQENFVFIPFHGRRDQRLRQFTPLAEVSDLSGDVGRPHHDMVVFDDGRMLFPLEQRLRHDDSASGGSRTEFAYDALGIWHPDDGRVEEVWNAREAWDILDPAQHWHPIVADDLTRWTHTNSVTVGPRGNIVLSVRNRNQVVSLSPDYKIEWQLFGPDSDYEFPNPADRFYEQHTASQLANGNILLFDNGAKRPDAEGGEYSRALELRLDDAAGTAVKVWEYRADPDIYAPIASSAYRLNNGNTLVNFGVRRPDETCGVPQGRWMYSGAANAAIVVVEADASENEVFRLETVQSDGRPVQYRANVGIEAIRGETMLRPPLTQKERHERMSHVAAGPFDLRLGDGWLVFSRAPCEAEDIALRFFLHVHPKERGSLPADRRRFGFDNLDFKFLEHGVLWNGRCLAELRLPEYAIDHIRAGQFATGDEAAGVSDSANGSSASASWSVEIPITP